MGSKWEGRLHSESEDSQIELQLCTGLGFRMHTSYKVSNDVWVELEIALKLTSGGCTCFLVNGPKFILGQSDS